MKNLTGFLAKGWNTSKGWNNVRQLAHGLLGLAMILALGVLLSGSAHAQEASKFAIGGDYNYVHTNAPPGGCGCFSLNGGDGWAAYNFSSSLGLVGQFSALHASNVLGSGTDATLVTYEFGPRYSYARSGKFEPFAQGLLGGATLVSGSGFLTTSSGTASAFAMTLGGGLDVRLTHHWTLRAAELDYFYTRFQNGANDHQNNLRVAAGLSYRF
jgi:peptidoglycan-associated lipoprotein